MSKSGTKKTAVEIAIEFRNAEEEEECRRSKCIAISSYKSEGSKRVLRDNFGPLAGDFAAVAKRAERLYLKKPVVILCLPKGIEEITYKIGSASGSPS